jgi:hypothetical protein
LGFSLRYFFCSRMCGFSEWIKNRGVHSNSRQYEVNLECFCNILHGSDGVWARMGEKACEQHMEGVHHIIRRAWLGNLYKLVFRCAIILTKCRSMNAMSAHNSSIMFFECRPRNLAFRRPWEDELIANSMHDLARYAAFWEGGIYHARLALG